MRFFWGRGDKVRFGLDVFSNQTQYQPYKKRNEQINVIQIGKSSIFVKTLPSYAYGNIIIRDI